MLVKHPSVLVKRMSVFCPTTSLDVRVSLQLSFALEVWLSQTAQRSFSNSFTVTVIYLCSLTSSLLFPTHTHTHTHTHTDTTCMIIAEQRLLIYWYDNCCRTCPPCFYEDSGWIHTTTTFHSQKVFGNKAWTLLFIWLFLATVGSWYTQKRK